MAPAQALVVQFIQFFANDRCMADLSLFQALRDMVQQGSQYVPSSYGLCLRADIEPNKCPGREKGLKAQYWGPSVNKVNEWYWLLCKFSYKYMRGRHTITINSTDLLARARTVTIPSSVAIT